MDVYWLEGPLGLNALRVREWSGWLKAGCTVRMAGGRDANREHGALSVISRAATRKLQDASSLVKEAADEVRRWQTEADEGTVHNQRPSFVLRSRIKTNQNNHRVWPRAVLEITPSAHVEIPSIHPTHRI